MIFSRKPSMQRNLVLMFVGTTIVLQLVLGSIAQYTVKSYFYELAANYVTNRFVALNGLNPVGPRNQKMIRGFERSSLKVWNIEDGEVNFQNSTTPLPSKAEDFVLKDKEATYVKQWKNGDDHYIALSFYINDNVTVAAGFNINHHIEFFEAINKMVFWFSIITSLLAGLYSIVIVRNGLRPLKRLEAYLTKVKPGRLDIRVPTKRLPVELEELSAAQNDMLNRLDEGFQRLSDFSSDIAHELRTPLTNLTTQTQVVLSSDRSIDEYRDTLGSNLEELERINKTINDTLYLAKAENALLYQNDEKLKICNVIDQLVEYHSIAAEDKELSIKMEGQGVFICDKNMFQRAINNLLSNAVRHSKPHSTIICRIEQQENMDLTIQIMNEGDTIPKESLPFIFDRFYRKDKSREHDYGFGAGLGLAITKSIIEIYGGTITATSEDGKTMFEIFFPANVAA
ncbi:HAMP domain-containing protein [Leucothrix sargassi]|nr:HAMP domain-containing protein [Leucothrix sargassi]